MDVEVSEAQVLVGGGDDDFQLAHMPCANKDEVDPKEANGIACAKNEGNLQKVDTPHNGGNGDPKKFPYSDGDEEQLEDDDDHSALYEARR